MTVSTPILAYAATLLAGVATGQSTSLTSTINITAGWWVEIPFQVRFSNVSNDPVINFYPTDDGGAAFDTAPMVSFSIPRVAAGTSRASVRVPTGMYVVQLLNSGPNTATFYLLTQAIMTAINNA